MTRQFEVTLRDGAARLGKLRWKERELTTPHILESKEDLELLKKAVTDNEELRVEVVSDPDDIGSREITADVVILGAALRFERDPRGLSRALMSVRESINPDAALYTPALATPANLSMLVYAGVDLIDTVLPEVKAREGFVLYTDGEDRFDETQGFPCVCSACLGTAVDNAAIEQRIARASEHNQVALRAELSRVRRHIGQGTLRELVEGRCRATPVMTAFLRLLDEAYPYFERRAPLVRTATLLACSQESLNRAEILRFNERVISRLTQREGILLLLPCSARKPYSRSRSHKVVLECVRAFRPFINEAIMTSPIGIVPRGLEVMYPAGNYDVPVTGKWTCDEKEWVRGRLIEFVEVNSFTTVIAHVDGPYREICDEAAAMLDVDVVYSVEDEGVLSPVALQRLEEMVKDAVAAHSPKRRDVRFDYIRDTVDYQFGKSTSARIFLSAPKVRGRFPTYYVSDGGRRVATLVEKYGTCALTVEGARRYIGKRASQYCVWIDDFVPKGTVFAIGVQRADPVIRPFDEVIVLNDNTIAVGRALMSGWEMQRSNRGAAVAVRHVEDR
ncbi:MAG: archaeosine synthase subunit alpha [Euryarchaeota archaeon]|nr:archaeosine synthase subunit alpha [Euryarchaeota archaeon]